MYTENDYENNDFDEYNEEEQQEVYEESFWDRNKSLIFKIIIIILCVLILIWLVSKLGNKKKVESNYDNNVTAVRLASEQYFFINNKPSTNKESVTVSELENRNLVKNVVDANGNACNTNNSVVTLENNSINYIMSIKLDCGKDSETRNFYYRIDNYACENCNGNTYMDGTTITPSKPEEENEPEYPTGYTCDWSEWTTVRDFNNGIDERTRVVVKAQKENKKEEVVYGAWSEWTEDVLEEADDLEVQSKTKVNENWVPMTSSTAVTASDTIRNVQKHTSGGSKYTYCPSGYEKYDGRCRKSNGSVRNLTPTEYLRLSTEERKSCKQTRPTANKVVWVCGGGYSYTDLKTGYTSGSTTYSYEQLEKTEVTVYRSRTKEIKTTILEPTVTGYILKSEVPSGYTIIAGSERTEYSYKLSSCGTK